MFPPPAPENDILWGPSPNEDDEEPQQQQQQPMPPRRPPGMDPFLVPPSGINTAPNNAQQLDPVELAVWQERERRARTVRVLMMFLLMLLLMDGDENNNNTRRGGKLRNGRRRSNNPNDNNNSPFLLDPYNLKGGPLEANVFQSRQAQDARIRKLVMQDERYHALFKKNQGHAMDVELWQELAQQTQLEKDQFGDPAAAAAEKEEEEEEEEAGNYNAIQQNDKTVVFHYPWNATGFYRGQWSRQKRNATISTTTAHSPYEPLSSYQEEKYKNATDYQQQQIGFVEATELEQIMLERVRQRTHSAASPTTTIAPLGVYILPQPIRVRDDNNLTSMQWERMTVDSSKRWFPAPPTPQQKLSALSRSISNSIADAATTMKSVETFSAPPPSVTLTQDSGRAAFQLYTRSIPGMKEVSVVDGFLKLYDSASVGYSSHQDVLLRVRGVLIHATGRLSLVSNVDVTQSALIIGDEDALAAQAAVVDRQRRRLQNLVDVNGMNYATDGIDHNIQEQLKVAVTQAVEKDKTGGYSRPESPDYQWSLTSPDFAFDEEREIVNSQMSRQEQLNERRLSSLAPARETSNLEDEATISTEPSLVNSNLTETSANASVQLLPRWSNIVIPFPFMRDDKDESFRRFRTPAARRMPPREQLLEANADACEFEITMNVREVEWTVGAWRTLLSHKVAEFRRLDPTQNHGDDEDVDGTASAKKRNQNLRSLRDRKRNIVLKDQALVMNMIGTIRSPNCDFAASVNATALRTDWEATTNKAINYSFFMMIVCLAQIIVLLRQLLHSQAQSTATRVSMLCIGWQTVVDALICLAHIYLSLAMQPLFTAFASVAFFKLLIFCVIEMKYMAIIIQARNSASGGQPTEVLRRQVAMLHLRFYAVLFGTFLLLFYVGEKYRAPYVLGLYSFWVPQIVLNIVTEAKTPMHKYYIYGMSLTRLVAPLYLFAVRRNFLREVYPDAPYDPQLCQLLILWVAFQAAVLIAQGTYGARFMIPARFLPPKFDYHRPIPAAMLPLEVQEMEDTLRGNGSSGTTDPPALISETTTTSHVRGRHTTAQTTRNRMRGKGRQQQQSESRTDSAKAITPAPMATSSRSDSGLTRSQSTTTTMRHHHHHHADQHTTLDCSICYEEIDVHDRQGYMLAPCDHVFHRDCLTQWMDVKAECPICRTELPPV